MSTYTTTIRRVTVALRAAAQTIGMTTDRHAQRRAIAELATWLRVLGFKADYRLDHIRLFGVELVFEDDLWKLDDAVGARNVAAALATMSEEVERRAGDDELTPYCWTDGTRLTKRELRAWLRA